MYSIYPQSSVFNKQRQLTSTSQNNCDLSYLKILESQGRNNRIIINEMATQLKGKLYIRYIIYYEFEGKRKEGI